MKKVRACESYEKLRLKAWDWYLRGDREQRVSVSELRVETLESEIVWERGDGERWDAVAWSTETIEAESERELKFEDEKWTEILRYRVFVQMVHFAPFFFFFWISAWIGWFGASIGGCGWYGPIQHESARVCAKSVRVGKPKIKNKKDAAPTSRQRHCRVGRGCSCNFAASLHPRWWPILHNIIQNWNP